MRRLLYSLLVLSLMLPFTAVAKEDEKKPASNSQSNNSSGQSNSANAANPSTPRATPTPSPNSTTAPNASASGNSNSAKDANNSNNSNNSSNSSTTRETGKSDQSTTPKPNENAKGKDVVLTEGETKNFIVKFRDDVSVASEATALRRDNAKVSRSFNNIFKGLSATLNAKQLEALKKNPRVELIEEDLRVTTTATQEGATWGLDRIDQRALPLSNTFTYSATGTNVRAYVIDTGVRATHLELSGRVQTGYTAISDGQGTNDCNGHGTHVSGTIAGSTYGVAKSVTIIPVRVLGCDGSGTLSGVVAGLDWIASTHNSGTPAVANMSLGAGASSTLDSAVNNLISRGVTVVVAAGNSTASACNYSPARVSAAITVAASTSSDQLASYSNFGSCVDVIAPGSSITSSWYSADNAIATLNGTSMASPHVAGVVAAMLSNGYLAPATIDSQVKSSATTNLFSTLPSGTPNLLVYANPSASEVTPSPTLQVPLAPTNVIAQPAKRAAQLTWTRTSNDGGSPVTSQIIYIISGGKTVSTATVSATATSATIRSLNNRLSYTFTVVAVNAVGPSPQSLPSNSITPLK